MWTKDATSESPKVIFTPGEGDANPGVRRIVFDPNANSERRVVIESAYMYTEGETADDIAERLGIS